MKKLLLAGLYLLTLTACGKKDDTVVYEKDSNIMLEEPKEKIANNSDNLTEEEEGLKLIEGTDCLSCHKIDAKLVGPSYQEIADRYTDADIEMLSQKIIDGGKGNWGEIPMTPHAGMSKENTKKMVKYILSLKR